jgi:hypothetical protein
MESIRSGSAHDNAPNPNRAVLSRLDLGDLRYMGCNTRPVVTAPA